MSQNKPKKNKNKSKAPIAPSRPTAATASTPAAAVQAVKGTDPQAKAEKPSWQSYGLDQMAQKLVLDALEADRDSLNQSYKMRMAVSYGLERFWGEHLRLLNNKKTTDAQKSAYWKATWDELVKVMDKAGVSIPNHKVEAGNTAAVRKMSEALWQLEPEVQRVSLAVLTQLCDCIVWWTQRYKGTK